MIRYKFSLAFLLPLFASLSLSGQNPSEQEDLIKLYKENHELRERLEQKDTEIKQLQEQLANYDQLNEELSNDGVEVKDPGAVNNWLKRTKDRLFKGKREADTVAELSQKNVDLTDRIAELEKQLELKDREIDNEQTINKTLQEELDNLSQFKKEYLVMLAKNVDTDWMNKKLSEINLVELDYAIKNYSQYSSEDPRLNDAVKKLRTLRHNTEVYNQVVEALNSQYNAAKVSALQKEINIVSNSLTNPKQADEVDEVSFQLFDYPGAVKAFKDIIAAVDKETNAEDTPAAAFAMADDLLQNDADIQRKLKQVNSIPWLKEQYQRYYASLKKDAKGPNATRSLILSL